MKQHGGALDILDHRILEELQKDSRLSMRELGRRIGLSAPAVTERVRRLEDAGVILGYSVQVAAKPLGRTITAFIAVMDSGRNDPALAKWAQSRDGVLECYSVTGGKSCILKVAVSDVAALDQLLQEILELGFTCDTSIILSSLMEYKPMLPPEQ